MTPASITESTRGELGQGIYSLGELRVFVSYPRDRKLGEWVVGWLTEVLNPVAHTPYQPDYSFSDLISLFVVRELSRRGVKPRRIRDGEQHLRKRWHTDRPFVSDRIATDGHHVYTDEEPVSEQPEAVEAASLRGQRVMVEPIREYLTSVRYHDGFAYQWAPVPQVVLDPSVQFGEPVIAGTRVRTADLAAVAAVLGIERAARRLLVDESAAGAAVEFERVLAELRD